MDKGTKVQTLINSYRNPKKIINKVNFWALTSKLEVYQTVKESGNRISLSSRIRNRKVVRKIKIKISPWRNKNRNSNLRVGHYSR